MTYTAFLILIVIIAILLILIIMVQNPKGGGLASTFGGGGSQSLGGVQNTNKFLDKATWTLAISLFALILLSNFSISRNSTNVDTRLNNTLEDVQPTSTNDEKAPATPVENNATGDTEKKTED
jgi:preprotein translocase subunit SecG